MSKQASIPLKPAVLDRLDGRLSKLLQRLEDDGVPHGDASVDCRGILDDFTHESGRSLTTGEKLLGPNWQAYPADHLAWGLFGDIENEPLAESLYIAFREMVRFTSESYSAFDKSKNREMFIEGLKRYFSRRGYDVQDRHERQHSENMESNDGLLDLLTIWEGRKVQPRQIVEFLWNRKIASWDSLPPNAFRGTDRPTDEAILKALKRIKTDLGHVFERFGVDLEIHDSERRVRLIKPSDKPDK